MPRLYMCVIGSMYMCTHGKVYIHWSFTPLYQFVMCVLSAGFTAYLFETIHSLIIMHKMQRTVTYNEIQKWESYIAPFDIPNTSANIFMKEACQWKQETPLVKDVWVTTRWLMQGDIQLPWPCKLQQEQQCKRLKVFHQKTRLDNHGTF